VAGEFDVRIAERGLNAIEQLGKDLKEAGAKDLRKELLRAGQRMGKPIKAEIAESALAMLPARNGLAASVASAKIRVSTRLTGRNVGVSFIGRWSGHDLKGINQGLVRHPVHGSKVWVSQRVPPGYYFKPFDGPAAEAGRDEFLQAVDIISKKLASGG
jgi:hypothetical protein